MIFEFEMPSVAARDFTLYRRPFSAMMVPAVSEFVSAATLATGNFEPVKSAPSSVAGSLPEQTSCVSPLATAWLCRAASAAYLHFLQRQPTLEWRACL